MLAYGVNPRSGKRLQIPERSWARNQCVGHSVSIDCDGIPRIIEFWSHAECPEHATDGNEKSSFCDMEPRTNPSPSTKVHVRPLSRVRTNAKELARSLVRVVAVRVKVARVFKPRGIIVDCPYLFNRVSWVLISNDERGQHC